MPKLNMFIFGNAKTYRDALLRQQSRDITNLYSKWAKEVGEKAAVFERKTTNSAPLQATQLRELQRMVAETGNEVSRQISNMITGNIYKIADSVVQANRVWLRSLGFSSNVISGAFSYVPQNIVNRLVTGQIYKGGWNLSSRIWSANVRTMQDVYEVEAGGLAQNKSIFEIAKDIEKYVQPGARKQWNLRAPDGRLIYPRQVDYSAQRLARTLAQHGYQQSFVEVTRNNPFILEYEWDANGSRACKICLARNGTRYAKDSLPLDHPNGMCTMVPVIASDMNDQLVNWFRSPRGTYPDIDNFELALQR